MSDSKKFLGQGFLKSLAAYPDKTALRVNDKNRTYAELGERALNVRDVLVSDETPKIESAGLLVGKSIDAYSSVLGTLLSGNAYIPMNPDHPSQRNKQIINDSDLEVIIVDKFGMRELPTILSKIDKQIKVIFTQGVENEHDSEVLDFRRVSNKRSGSLPSPSDIQNISPTETAYILFTSGSTGRPKGVPITHQNARSYLEYIWEIYELDSSDRFSQFFDLTFDLSVHDMFVCWGVGGSLNVIPEDKKMAPGQFIKDRKLTVWFTVPSTAMFMSQFGQLDEDSYPDLRYSLFCGEALSGRLASMWQKAAPNAAVDNLYGPTEATIATTRYRWQPNESLEYCENGITPIGEVFPHQQGQILSRNGDVVNQGEEGELCVKGPQVFNGYINRPDANDESFVEIDNTSWYRTGDLVREDEAGRLHFISRIDNQIQIRGHRVELLEIEATIRDIVDSEMVAAVGWPIEEGIAQSLQAFIATEEQINADKIINTCKSEMPDYMIPKKIHRIEEMPLNVNGKIDRRQLEARLNRNNV